MVITISGNGNYNKQKWQVLTNIFAISKDGNYNLPFLPIFVIIDSLIVIRSGYYNQLVKALREVDRYYNRFVIIVSFRNRFVNKLLECRALLSTNN